MNFRSSFRLPVISCVQSFEEHKSPEKHNHPRQRRDEKRICWEDTERQDDVEKREYHRNNEHRDSVARWDSGAQVFVVRTSVFLVYVADDAQANGVKANVVSDCHEVSSVIWNVLVVDSPKREQDACFDREEKRKSNRKYAHDEEEHELLFRQLAELRKCPHALPEKERKEPC